MSVHGQYEYDTSAQKGSRSPVLSVSSMGTAEEEVIRAMASAICARNSGQKNLREHERSELQPNQRAKAGVSVHRRR